MPVIHKTEQEHLEEVFKNTPYEKILNIIPKMFKRHLDEINKMLPSLSLTKGTRARYVDPLEKAKIDQFTTRVEKEIEAIQAKKAKGADRYNRRFK